MNIGTLVVGGLSGGFGFVLADGLDRFLATYDPSATTRPTDKFTSDGAGTLGNTLNAASRPGLVRAGAAIGMVAVPAVGSMFVKNGYAKTALTCAAFGAGINGFKMLWNSVIMPMLRPKDTSPASLQKSVIARLYPAEVAAAINLAKKNADGSERTPALNAPGALSGADVGPFALSGDSPYPDAAQALRRETGIHGPSDYPSLQNTWGTGDYPTAAQAIYKQAGRVGVPETPAASPVWQPGPPTTPGPGPQPESSKSCGCVGQYDQFLGIGSAEESTSES